MIPRLRPQPTGELRRAAGGFRQQSESLAGAFKQEDPRATVTGMNADDSHAASRTEIRSLLDSFTTVPAFLCDRHFTVIASNDVARLLSPGFAEGVNLARFAFLEPDLDRRNPMWHEASAQIAALLRESLDEHDPDSDFRRIVGELSALSHDFSVAWADQAKAARPRGVVPFDDATGSTIRLSYQLLRVPDDYDDMLFVWQPVDQASSDALRELISSGPGRPG